MRKVLWFPLFVVALIGHIAQSMRSMVPGRQRDGTDGRRWY